MKRNRTRCKKRDCEFEPMSKELARIVADATKQDCELQPMTPELSRLVDEMLTTKQDCDEFEQMPPELSRLVDEVLCPDRRRATTTMPRRPPKDVRQSGRRSSNSGAPGTLSRARACGLFQLLSVHRPGVGSSDWLGGVFKCLIR